MDLGSIVTALIEKPQHLPLIAALALAWVTLTWAFGLVARTVGGSLHLSDDDARRLLPQAICSILILHVLFSAGSSILFWRFTELPSPVLFKEGYSHPVFSPRTEGYFLSACVGSMALISLVSFRDDFQPFKFLMGWTRPGFALFGVIGAIVLVYQGAFDDPRMPTLDNFANWFEMAAWKYGLVSFASISVSMTAYAAALLLQAVWWLAGSVLRE